MEVVPGPTMPFLNARDKPSGGHWKCSTSKPSTTPGTTSEVARPESSMQIWPDTTHCKYKFPQPINFLWSDLRLISHYVCIPLRFLWRFVQACRDTGPMPLITQITIEKGFFAAITRFCHRIFRQICTKLCYAVILVSNWAELAWSFKNWSLSPWPGFLS